MEIPPKKSVEIVQISGGKSARKTLSQLGISIGSRVSVQRNAPFSGPLLIENDGTTVAIGRGIASRILVKEI